MTPALPASFLGATLPDNLAPRHALLNVFHRASLRRIVLVSAAAGSGKTVSTQLWLQNSERTPIWIQLHEEMNDPVEFYRAIGKGLVATLPDAAEAEKILADPDFGSDPYANIRRCIAALPPDDEFYALVVDDMHRIVEGEIWKSLPDVLAALPAGFVSILLSRTDPPDESLAARLAGRRASRIGGAALAFSAEEIAGYFRAAGRNVSLEEASAAHAQTGGWAMGVRALAMGGDLSLVGGQDLGVYLRKNIWENWDPALREALLRLSVVEELTAELAERLTGRADAAALLDEMCDNNTFITKSGVDLYRFHHLFLDFLVAARREAEGLDEAALYGIAAAYYREYGMLYEALHASGKAGDIRGVEECMYELYHYRTRGNSVAEHARYMRTHLIDILPDGSLEQAPFLLINYIWYYFLVGDAESMFRYLDRFYASFKQIIKKHRHFHGLGILISVLDCRFGYMEKATELAQGFKPDDAEEAQTITATENMPFFHRSHRDYSHTAPEVDRNMAPVLELMPPIMKGATVALFHGVVASLHYEMNNLAAAEEHLKTSFDNLADDSVMELRFCAMLLQALLRRAAGDEKECAAVLARLEALLRNPTSAHLLPNFEAVRTKYLLMDARRQTAEAWLGQYYVVDTERPELFRIFQHLTTARAHLVLGNVDRAERWLAVARGLGTDFDRPLDVAEADTLRAAAEWATGRRKEAVSTLRGVLVSMGRHGFTRIVAEEGAAVLPILKQMLRERSARDTRDAKRGRDEPDEAYVRAVHDLAQAEAKRRRGVAWNIGLHNVKLSRQQVAVLRHMAAGSGAEAIASATGLALPTVKAHASAAYKKLGVHTSRDAVARARELRLLE